MKTIITTLFMVAAFYSKAQTTVDVKFKLNSRPITIEKQQVKLTARDTLQIEFVSRDPVNVEEIWVQPINKKVGQGKEQTTVLVAGEYKKLRGFRSQRKYTINIHLSNFNLTNLVKLKINIINCSNAKGDKLIKNTKAYEINARN